MDVVLDYIGNEGIYRMETREDTNKDDLAKEITFLEERGSHEIFAWLLNAPEITIYCDGKFTGEN